MAWADRNPPSALRAFRFLFSVGWRRLCRRSSRGWKAPFPNRAPKSFESSATVFMWVCGWVVHFQQLLRSVIVCVIVLCVRALALCTVVCDVENNRQSCNHVEKISQAHTFIVATHRDFHLAGRFRSGGGSLNTWKVILFGVRKFSPTMTIDMKRKKFALRRLVIGGFLFLILSGLIIETKSVQLCMTPHLLQESHGDAGCCVKVTVIYF